MTREDAEFTSLVLAVLALVGVLCVLIPSSDSTPLSFAIILGVSGLFIVWAIGLFLYAQLHKVKY